MRTATMVACVVGALLLPARGSAQAPPTAVTVELVQGWNNLAYFGPTLRVETFALPLGASLGAVWEFDAAVQAWRGYDPRAPQASDLEMVTSYRSLWLAMRASGTLTFTPSFVRSPVTLYSGMNHLAYAGQETPLAEAFAGTDGRVKSVWRWNAANQRWQGAIVGAPAASEFTSMTPGTAYVVQLAPGRSVELTRVEVGRPPPPSGQPAPAASSRPVPRAGCYPFQARQPDLPEIRGAFNRAGFGLLTTDPMFVLPRLETDPNGDGGLVDAYIPPTLLKAIGWTESSWRQAAYEVPRGGQGRTLSSSSCAFGIMQVLTGMNVEANPTPRQERIGQDFQHNIAGGARILAEKWNLAPSFTPIVRPRVPRVLEDWYYAVWAYHCFGERCREFNIRDHPEDPALTWPRPVYNSPEQLSSRGRFTRADYPYQELVYGLVQYPPIVDGRPIWPPLPITLPPPGTISFPRPQSYDRSGGTTDPTSPNDP